MGCFLSRLTPRGYRLTPCSVSLFDLSLSTENGRVSIRWDRRSNGQSRSHLVFERQEIGGSPVEAPSKPSYGTTTIRELIPYEFGGTVDLVLASDGVRCRMELPAA